MDYTPPVRRASIVTTPVADTERDGIEPARQPQSSFKSESGIRAKVGHQHADENLPSVTGGHASGKERHYLLLISHVVLCQVELCLLRMFRSNLYMQNDQELNKYNRHRQPKQNWLMI